jgi:type 1 fimbriae regulatory protein FimB/type 1 fimbriae regulatory protein FimE
MQPSSNAVLRFPVRSTPNAIIRNVPLRRKNADYRSREYLTEQEVEQLIDAAGRVGRHGHRDATLILLSFRHGLRVTELISMRWDQIDLKQGLMHVNRLKQGTPSVHPLRGPELRALRRLQRDYTMMPYVFTSERKAPLTDDAIRKIVGRAGREAKLPFSVHPHMLRHACGYKLAQAGQDTRAIQHYLGHKNIQHTVRYTQLSAERFKSFWKD